MATTYHTDLQKLYVAYFTRPADPAGLAYWEGIVEASNGNTAAVSAAFAASAEYKAAYANMTNSQIVDKVYQNLFSRTADAGGKAYWSDLLDRKVITIDTFVAEVAAGAIGTDMTAFNNKAAAAVAFTNALDTDAEKAGYTLDSINLAKDFIGRVTTNASLAAETNPAALNATISAVVAAGTEFTLVGGLQGLEAAIAAKDAYLKSITEEDATATATEESVAEALSDAQGEFNTVFAAQNPAAFTVYSATTTTDTVKAALIADQVAVNADALVGAQRNLSTVTAEVAKVPGLQNAMNKLAAAETTQENAVKAHTSAELDLRVKAASFEVTSASKFTATQDVVYNDNGTVDLFTPAVAGTPGSPLIPAVPPDEDADGNPIPGTGSEEIPAVPPVAAVPAKTTPLIELKDGVLTLAVTEKAYPGITALLNATVTEQITEVAVTNSGIVVASAQANVATLDKGGLAASYEAATDRVTAAEANIKSFTEVLAAQNSAEAQADALAGFEATITASTDLFADNDYNLVNVGAADTSLVATVDSDVYVVGKSGSIINLFGLQGEDSLFVGTGFTLNRGALSTGVDTAKEIFVSQTGANTTLQIETSAFGSSAASPEVVKIVLVGVTATDIALDANGIITA